MGMLEKVKVVLVFLFGGFKYYLEVEVDFGWEFEVVIYEMVFMGFMSMICFSIVVGIFEEYGVLIVVVMIEFVSSNDFDCFFVVFWDYFFV